ncbi:MAG: 5-formyltetrahydrofolate cyclo-ligase [Alphaproteobacteria bacterium]|nr:5-formyltetrahydrofolate cyclo-ligase [Alphaproteobacteria bacterium]
MADSDFDDLKAALRDTARSQRARVASGDRAEAAKQAAEHFLSGVPFAKTDAIALYWPIRDEIDCKPLLLKLMEAGQTICLPVVVGSDASLVWRVWEPDAPLFESGFGTLAPGDLAPEAVPDIMVMPLLGFDRAGTRLGYGRGYYDRTIAAAPNRPLLVGYAFSAQELNEIPHAGHDVPLDLIVTEAGVRRFDN